MRLDPLTFAIRRRFSPRAAAQEYPSRPVLFVVPYQPGGGTETMARLIGRRLEQRLGKPFVVDNRPGAGTVIGATFVAKRRRTATPSCSPPARRWRSTSASTATCLRSRRRTWCRSRCSPTCRSCWWSIRRCRCTRSRTWWRSPSARQAGSPMRRTAMAEPLISTPSCLKSTTGIAMTHVPYKGLAPALNDVVAGHVPLMFGDFATALPLVRDGKLRALGVSTAQRVAAAPDLPPLAEVGMPGFDASSWQMMIAPGGLPEAIVDKLNAELRDDHGRAGYPEGFRRPRPHPGREPVARRTAGLCRSEIVRWGKVVEQAGAAGSQ